MECLETHTVGIYIKKYIDNGLKGLEMKYSPGKKRKLSKEQEIELVKKQNKTKKPYNTIQLKNPNNYLQKKTLA